MINLLRAEWLKLSRRPLALILLGIFLAQLALVFTLYFALALLATGNGAVPTGGVGIRPELLAHYRAQLRFPGVWGAVLGQLNGIGGICAIILTAGALGSEYSWGTLRAQLARQPGRGRFLAAKLGAVLLLLLLPTGARQVLPSRRYGKERNTCASIASERASTIVIPTGDDNQVGLGCCVHNPVLIRYAP